MITNNLDNILKEYENALNASSEVFIKPFNSKSSKMAFDKRLQDVFPTLATLLKNKNVDAMDISSYFRGALISIGKTNNGDGIAIKILNSTQIFFRASKRFINDDPYLHTSGRYSPRTFLFYDNGGVYAEKKDNKSYFPTPLKNIQDLCKTNFFFKTFFISWLNVMSRNFPIYKDILRSLNADALFCNISLCEIINYHSQQDLIKGHYKRCKDVCKAANRIPLSEAVAKALFELHVPKNDRQKVWNSKGRTENEILVDLYQRIPEINLNSEDNHYVHLLQGYFKMCIELNIDINLHISSKEKLISAHNALISAYDKKIAKKTAERIRRRDRRIMLRKSQKKSQKNSKKDSQKEPQNNEKNSQKNNT